MVSVILSTSNTAVGGLQVRLEILRARLSLGERRVRYRDLTASTTRTAPVDRRHDVSPATHVTVVLPHAPAQPHPAVLRMRHQDGFADAARGVERLCFAERLERNVIG